MSVFSRIAEKLLGKRIIETLQPVVDLSAEVIIELIADGLSDDDVNLIMNACRRRLRKTVPK